MKNLQLTLDVKSDDFSNETRDFALSIFEFVQKKQDELKPLRIFIFHHIDGMVSIKCDNYIFTAIHSSNDEHLLQIISSFAEKWDVKGKIFSYITENFYKVLEFSFSYI